MTKGETMTFAPNPVEKALKDGKPVLGIEFMTESHRLIEIAGWAGFDYIQFDMEHTPYSFSNIEGFVRTADGAGMTSIVRVAETTATNIRLVRDRTPPGMLTLDLKNTEIREPFTATGDDGSDQMSMGINSPAYRAWFDEYKYQRGRAPSPENPNAVAQGELGETWLTTNFWRGSTGSTVKVSIDGGGSTDATRTQSMTADDVPLVGPEYTDPSATLDQLVHGGGL